MPRSTNVYRSAVPQIRQAALIGSCGVMVSELQYRLARVEGLGITAGRAALHTPKPHQTRERFIGEPVFIPLAAERAKQVFYLALAGVVIHGHEAIRRAQIAVEFRDFIFENPVITESVRGQLREHSMILMPI